MKTLIIITTFLSVFSCSMLVTNESGTYTKSSNVHNNLQKNLPPNWQLIDKETSDFAISNKSSGSVFVINSACRKFEASNLNSLTSSILSGVEIVNVIDRKIITLQGRDAIDMTVQGKVDGVSRFFHLTTTQKNNCIYDFVLISTNEHNLEMDNKDFQVFLNRIELN